MSTIVIMPGGFHPFHAGHMSLYNAARKAFPDAEVYVAATNSQEERPFPFAIKEKLAKVAGVKPGHFIQVKSPFQAKEITQNYNPEQDILIFVRSEKDRNESPKPGGTKKDGTPAYFQPYDANNLQPFGKHAYFAYLPTVKFGPGITSATEIRKAWPTLDDRRKTAMVMSLYPATQKNPKLAANVVKMLDIGMAGQQSVAEGLDDPWGPQGNFAGDTPVNVGGISMKTIQLGDTVKYLGQKAKVLAMSKDRKYSRITISSGFGGTTKDVLTSDLTQLGQGIAEGSDGWIGNPTKWKEAVHSAHGPDVVFKNYSHPGQPGKRSVHAWDANNKIVGVYQRHNKMGMVQPNMQGVAEGSESLDYQGNCTEDDVVDDIFGDVNNFANMVEKYGDEFTRGNLVVKYDPKKDVHYFYYKKQGVAEGAPIVVMPSPERLKKPEPTKVRYQGDIVPPTKPPSTEKRGVKGRPGQRPMPATSNSTKSDDYVDEK